MTHYLIILLTIKHVAIKKKNKKIANRHTVSAIVIAKQTKIQNYIRT